MAFTFIITIVLDAQMKAVSVRLTLDVLAAFWDGMVTIVKKYAQHNTVIVLMEAVQTVCQVYTVTIVSHRVQLTVKIMFVKRSMECARKAVLPESLAVGVSITVLRIAWIMYVMQPTVFARMVAKRVITLVAILVLFVQTTVQDVHL